MPLSMLFVTFLNLHNGAAESFYPFYLTTKLDKTIKVLYLINNTSISTAIQKPTTISILQQSKSYCRNISTADSVL